MGVRLLEREGALGALRAAWEEVRRAHRGQVVLVRGEAGSGKTSLLDAFNSELGAPVWTGSCHPLSTPRPLGPFAELADQIGGELGVVTRDGRPHEVATALTRLCAEGPCVVVVEDLHWADDASLDVLRSLLRPLRDRSLLVLVSYREDEVERSSALQAALGELTGPGTSRIDVSPLSREAVRTMSLGTGRDAAALHRLTGGNAFFVTEALAADDEAIPSTVVDASLARLARLTPAARAVAEAVAVVPQEAELWLVGALGDVEHIDEAVAGGVLRGTTDGVTFRHELARLAIEGTLPPYRRVMLHQKALAALAAHPEAEPARLAHHAEAAKDSAAVLVYARAAAERAARLGAKREAAAHWEQALCHVPPDQPLLRADLLEQFSYAAYLVDRMDEAVVTLEEALATRRTHGDRPGEGRVLLDLSRRLACAARERESAPCIDAALVVLEALPPTPDLALGYGLKAYGCIEQGDEEGTRRWGGRAVELADQLGAVYPKIYALNTMGTSELFRGRDPELLLESLRLAREHDLDEPVGRALMNLCTGYSEQRRLEELDFVVEAVADCDRRGLELWRRYLVVNVAEMHLALGRWDEAADAVAPIIASLESAKLLRLVALCVSAKVRLRRGDPGAREALQEAEAVAAGHQGLPWSRCIALLRAEFAWLDGTDVRVVTDEALADSRSAGELWGVDELLLWRRLGGVTGDQPSGRTPWSTPSPATWRKMGAGFDAGLALLEQGDALEALALLQLVGAHGTAARVAKDLRERGVRELPRGPRSSTRSNPAQLTDRELDVVRLVAEGLANSAIAEYLVLSTKTVDKHVSAALHKLGLSSRREVGARVLELGFETSGV